jgi:NhaP-type Na+/H+ or K+/H+ antiporter
MNGIAGTLRLAGAAIGAVGAVLLFVEFFQVPSYVDYDTDFESYNLVISPTEAREYTWFGRIGALALALAFTLQTVAAFLG